MTTLACPSGTPPPSLAKLRHELRRLQRAVSGSPVGIAFESPFTSREWLSVCADRPAGQQADESGGACGNCTSRQPRRLVGFDPSGIGPCQICLCSPDPAASTVFDCIEELLKTIVEIHEYSEREQPLFRELAANLEMLEALYETGLDLQRHDSLQQVTDRLLDRSISAAPDISAVLWMLEDDHFRAVAQRCCEAPAERSQFLGLVGQAHRSGVPIVVDSCSSELVDTEVDLELRGSGPVAVIPVHTRQGLTAVFEVWRKSGEPPFETPAIRLLEAIAQQITLAIETDRFHRAALEGERVAQEIEIGNSIQQQLLFGNSAEKLVGGEIGHCMITSRLASGDFYVLVRHSDVCLDVVIGDVMGKGIPAALTGAATKIALLRVLAESKGSGEARRFPEPAEIVTAANRQMSGQLEKMNSFVTLFYGRFDFGKKTLTYVDAGHTETVHFIRETGSIELLRGEGFPLGFSGSETYQQSMVQLGAGDIVFAYSDGMTESTDPQGTPYATARIGSYLKQHASSSASEIIRGMADDLKTYQAGTEPNDDLTLLAIKVGGLATHRYVMVAHLDQLEGLRNWLANTLRTGAPVSIGDEGLFRLQLALQEAAANIICHGTRPGLPLEISVDAHFEGSNLYLELAYDGLAFSRESAPAPSFDGSRDHGFGLFLIDQLMDEVTYSFTEGRNSIRLSKELNGLQE
jgi:serine phosphatase RsbU (regulator of sigma subunit)/anti-sigma regulatory factor (Ser/Thr protein kinase)